MAVDVSGDGGVLKQVIQEGNGQKVRTAHCWKAAEQISCSSLRRADQL